MLGSLLVETPHGRRTYKHYGTTRNGTPRFASFLRVRADHWRRAWPRRNRLLAGCGAASPDPRGVAASPGLAAAATGG